MVRKVVSGMVLVVGVAAAASAQDAKAKGEQVFAAQKCSLCHSIGGKGNPKGALDDVGSKAKPEEIRAWIVDAKGMTLYTFDKDEMGKSNCYDKCAVNWPPYMAEANAMAEGDWTVVDRTDGTKQWADEGKPLYTFIKDKKPGDVMGDSIPNWHAVKE